MEFGLKLHERVLDICNINAILSKSGKWPFWWYTPGIIFCIFNFYFFILFLKYYELTFIYNILTFNSYLFYFSFAEIFGLIFLTLLFNIFLNNNLCNYIIKKTKKEIKKIEILNIWDNFLFLVYLKIKLKVFNLSGTLFFLYSIIVLKSLLFYYFFYSFICIFPIYLQIFWSFVFIFFFFIFYILRFYNSFFKLLLKGQKFFGANLFLCNVLVYILKIFTFFNVLLINEEKKISRCFKETYSAYRWEIYWLLYSNETESGDGNNLQSHAYTEITSNPMAVKNAIENLEVEDLLEEYKEMLEEALEDELIIPKKQDKVEEKEDILKVKESNKIKVEKTTNWTILENSQLWATLIEEYRQVSNEFYQNFNKPAIEIDPSLLNNEIFYDEISKTYEFLDFNSSFVNVEEEEESFFQFEYECIGRWTIYTTPFELKFWAIYQYLYIYRPWICELLSISFFIFIFFIFVVLQFFFLNSILCSIDNFIWFFRVDIFYLIFNQTPSWSFIINISWSNLLTYIWFFVCYFIFIDENDAERALTPLFDKKGNFISARNFEDWMSWKMDIMQDWRDLYCWVESDNILYQWGNIYDFYYFFYDMNELNVTNIYQDLQNKTKKKKKFFWIQKKTSEELDYLNKEIIEEESFLEFPTMFRTSWIELFFEIWYFFLFKAWNFFIFWPSLRHFITNLINVLFYIISLFCFIFFITPLLIWLIHVRTEPEDVQYDVNVAYLTANVNLTNNPLSRYYDSFFDFSLLSENGINFAKLYVQSPVAKKWYKQPMYFTFFENYYNTKKKASNYRMRSYLAQNELLYDYSEKTKNLPINDQGVSLLPINNKLVQSWGLHGSGVSFEEEYYISFYKNENEEKIMAEKKKKKYKIDDKFFNYYNEKIKDISPFMEEKKINDVFFILKNAENKSELHDKFKNYIKEYFIIYNEGKSFFDFSGDTQYLGNHSSFFWKKEGRFITQSNAEVIFGTDINYLAGLQEDFQNNDTIYNYASRKAINKLSYFKSAANYAELKKNYQYVYPFHIHNIQPISALGRSRWFVEDGGSHTAQNELYASNDLYIQEVEEYLMRIWVEDFDFINDASEQTFCGLPLNWKHFVNIKAYNKLSKFQVIDNYNKKNEIKNIANKNKVLGEINDQKSEIKKFFFNEELKKLNFWYIENLKTFGNLAGTPVLKKQNKELFFIMQNVSNRVELLQLEKYQLKAYFDIIKEIKICKEKYKQYLRLYENKKENMLSLMLLWNNKLITFFENEQKKNKNMKSLEIQNKQYNLINYQKNNVWALEFFEITKKIQNIEKKHNYNVFLNEIQKNNFKIHLLNLEKKLKNNFYFGLFLQQKFKELINFSTPSFLLAIEEKEQTINFLDVEEVSERLEKFNKDILEVKKEVFHRKHINVYERIKDPVEDKIIFNSKTKNQLLGEFLYDSNQEKIYKKRYWGLYKELKFLNKNYIKEVDSTMLNVLRNNQYIKDLIYFIKNYNILNDSDFHKIFLLSHRVKNYEYQTEYEKQQIRFLINFIGKHYGWKGNVKVQKIQFINFLENLYRSNAQHKKNLFLIKSDIQLIKKLIILEKGDVTKEKLIEYIEKNSLIACFYNIIANEDKVVVNNFINLLLLKNYLFQFLSCGIKGDIAMKELLIFFESFFPELKTVKNKQYKIRIVLDFLDNYTTYTVNNNPNVLHEIELLILQKSETNLGSIPDVFFRNKEQFFKSLNNGEINNYFLVVFLDLLNEKTINNLTVNQIEILKNLEKSILEYKNLLKLNVNLEDDEMDDFFQILSNFSFFDEKKDKCASQVLALLSYVSSLEKKKTAFDSLSHVIEKAKKEYVFWDDNVQNMGVLYNNQILGSLENKIWQHKNWIAYINKTVLLKIPMPIKAIRPEYLTNTPKNFFSRKDFTYDKSKIFYASWLRNLTRVSEKNTVWSLKTKILGPNNIINKTFFKNTYKADSIFKEVEKIKELPKREVIEKKDIFIDEEKQKAKEKENEELALYALVKDESLQTIKPKEAVERPVLNEIQQEIYNAFRADIAERNKNFFHKATLDNPNKWTLPNFKYWIISDTLLKGILECVDNAEIKLLYEKNQEELMQYVNELNKILSEKKNMSHRKKYCKGNVDITYTIEHIFKIFEAVGDVPLTMNNEKETQKYIVKVFENTMPSIKQNNEFLKKVSILSILGPIIKELNDPTITFARMQKFVELDERTGSKVSKRLFDRSFVKIYSKALIPFSKEELIGIFKNIRVCQYEDNKVIMQIDYLKNNLILKNIGIIKNLGFELDILKWIQSIINEKKLKENEDFVTFIQRRKNASNFGTEEAKTYIPYDMQKIYTKKGLILQEEIYCKLIENKKNFNDNKIKFGLLNKALLFAKGEVERLGDSLAGYKRLSAELDLIEIEKLKIKKELDKKYSEYAKAEKSNEWMKKKHPSRFGKPAKLHMEWLNNNKIIEAYNVMYEDLISREVRIPMLKGQLVKIFYNEAAVSNAMVTYALYKVNVTTIESKKEIFNIFFLTEAEELIQKQKKVVDDYRLNLEKYLNIIYNEKLLKRYANYEEMQEQCQEGIRQNAFQKEVEKYKTPIERKDEQSKAEFIRVKMMIYLENANIYHLKPAKKSTIRNYIHDFVSTEKHKIKYAIEKFIKINEKIEQNKDKTKFIFEQDSNILKKIMDDVLEKIANEFKMELNWKILYDMYFAVKKSMTSNYQTDIFYDFDEPNIEKIKQFKKLIEIIMLDEAFKFTGIARTFTFKEFEHVVTGYYNFYNNNEKDPMIMEKTILNIIYSESSKLNKNIFDNLGKNMVEEPERKEEILPLEEKVILPLKEEEIKKPIVLLDESVFIKESSEKNYESWWELEPQLILALQEYLGKSCISLINERHSFNGDDIAYDSEDLFLKLKDFCEKIQVFGWEEEIYRMQVICALCLAFNSYENFYFCENGQPNVIQLNREQVAFEIANWDRLQKEVRENQYNNLVYQTMKSWLQRAEIYDLLRVRATSPKHFFFNKIVFPPSLTPFIASTMPMTVKEVKEKNWIEEWEKSSIYSKYITEIDYNKEVSEKKVIQVLHENESINKKNELLKQQWKKQFAAVTRFFSDTDLNEETVQIKIRELNKAEVAKNSEEFFFNKYFIKKLEAWLKTNEQIIQVENNIGKSQFIWMQLFLKQIFDNNLKNKDVSLNETQKKEDSLNKIVDLGKKTSFIARNLYLKKLNEPVETPLLYSKPIETTIEKSVEKGIERKPLILKPEERGGVKMKATVQRKAAKFLRDKSLTIEKVEQKIAEIRKKDVGGNAKEEYFKSVYIKELIDWIWIKLQYKHFFIEEKVNAEKVSKKLQTVKEALVINHSKQYFANKMFIKELKNWQQLNIANENRIKELENQKKELAINLMIVENQRTEFFLNEKNLNVKKVLKQLEILNNNKIDKRNKQENYYNCLFIQKLHEWLNKNKMEIDDVMLIYKNKKFEKKEIVAHPHPKATWILKLHNEVLQKNKIDFFSDVDLTVEKAKKKIDVLEKRQGKLEKTSQDFIFNQCFILELQNWIQKNGDKHDYIEVLKQLGDVKTIHILATMHQGVSNFFSRKDLNINLIYRKLGFLYQNEMFGKIADINTKKYFAKKLREWIIKYEETKEKNEIKEKISKKNKIFFLNIIEKKVDFFYKENPIIWSNEREVNFRNFIFKPVLMKKDSRGVYHWTPEMGTFEFDESAFNEEPFIWGEQKKTKKFLFKKPKIGNEIFLINVFEKGEFEIQDQKPWVYKNNGENVVDIFYKKKNLRILYHEGEIKKLENLKKKRLCNNLNIEILRFFDKSSEFYCFLSNHTNSFFENKFCLQNYYTAKFKLKYLDEFYFLNYAENQKWPKLFTNEHLGNPVYGGILNNQVSGLFEMHLHENPLFLKRFHKEKYYIFEKKSRELDYVEMDIAVNFKINQDEKDEENENLLPMYISIVSARDSSRSLTDFYLRIFEMETKIFSSYNPTSYSYQSKLITPNLNWKQPIYYKPTKELVETYLDGKAMTTLINNDYIKARFNIKVERERQKQIFLQKMNKRKYDDLKTQLITKL